MRTTVAVMTAITFLFVGVTAISESAQQVKPSLDSEAANQSYNLSVDVFGHVGEAGRGIVLMGIAAIIVVALGYLVVTSSGGR